MKDNLFEEPSIKKVSELEVSIRQLRKSGTAYAEAERDYKVTLMQELLKLRADGNGRYPHRQNDIRRSPCSG